MLLKNKKTGEISEPFGIACINGRTFIQFDDGKGTFKFEAHSLAELNEEWEDVPEEPKEYWYLSGRGEVRCIEDDGVKFDKDHKEIGNYFESKEEAEKAVEKLEAWKRLKDKGFRFDSWDENHHNLGIIEFSFDKVEDNVWDFEKDLDLLFGGEE